MLTMSRYNPIRLAWLTMGFTAMVGQIVLMRELIVVFYGNEVSIGTILASWLFWVAVGSFGLGRLVDRVKKRVSLLILCEIAISIILPLCVSGVRVSRFLLNVEFGEIIGFFPMFYTSFIILAPLCIICGFLFALNCRIPLLEPTKPVTQIGRVYIFESLGAAIGGALTSYFLIKYVSPFQIVGIVSGLNLFVATLLALTTARTWTYLTVSLLGVSIYFTISGGEKLGVYLNNFRWGDYELLHTKDSVYGNIAITKKNEQRNVYANGLLLFSTPDTFTVEESSHFPLLEHPSPRSVLLIGGGVGGAIGEILKHKVERIDYVELDPLIIETSLKFLQSEFTAPLDSPQVKVIYTDGRFFVKNTNSKYDCIIINLPSPSTAQLNRFYTEEFFKEAKEILNPGGILSFSVTSAENYISRELGQFLSSLHKTLAIFDNVVIIPGDVNIFLASNKKGMLSLDPWVLVHRLKERGVETKYIREYYLPYRMTEERIAYLQQRIAEEKGARINRDFYPISYYYDMILWSTHFQTKERQIFTYFFNLNFRLVLLTLVGFGIVMFCLSLKFKNLPILLAVGTTGSAEIVFEVLTMLAFQILYGYIYYKLGVILTAFMLGLTFGAIFIVNRMKRVDLKLTDFAKIQLAVCVYPLILFSVFTLLYHTGPSKFSVEIIFPLLTFIAGFVGGMQFPLANKLYLQRVKKVGHTAGITYGIDLFGSCVGALFAAAILIPILGIPDTCFIVAMLNGISLALIILTIYRKSQYNQNQNPK